MSWLGRALGTVGGFVIGGPAGASLGAAIGGGYDAHVGAQEQNARSVAASAEQMAFQERMSSTAYQRAVKDMQSAGLNPMLAYSQGGASAPMGSMPAVNVNEAQAGITSAAQGLELTDALVRIEKTKADMDLVKAQADEIRSRTMPNEVNTAIAVRRIDALAAQAKYAFQKAGLTDAQRQDAYNRLYAMLEGSGYEAQVQQFRNIANTGFHEEDLKRWLAQLAQLDLARGKAESKFYESNLGEASPSVRFIVDLLKQLTAASAARGR